MPRLPKHPSVRQRRNQSSTRATLRVMTPEEQATAEIPELPTIYDRDGTEKPWSARTIDWWVQIWLSPMAPEFHESDIEGLFRMAYFQEAFWDPRTSNESRLKAMAELRHWEAQFGLNPLARRRLEWTIENTEAAQDAGDDRRRDRSLRQSSRPTAVSGEGETDPLSA